MSNKYDLSKIEINYKAIYVFNKYLTEGQFVKLCKGFNCNYFILDSGFIHEKILNRITIGFLDVVQPDNDSIGRQRLRAEKCEYRVYASLKLKEPEDKYFSYISDRYEIVLVDIYKRDYDKFKLAMSSVINMVFNNRELEYFEILTDLLQFTYSFILKSSKKFNLIKDPLKHDAYNQYHKSISSYIKNYELLIKELQENQDNKPKQDKDLYGRRIHNG